MGRGHLACSSGEQMGIFRPQSKIGLSDILFLVAVIMAICFVAAIFVLGY